MDEAVLATFEQDALDLDATVEAMTGEATRRLTEARALAAAAEREAAQADEWQRRADEDYLGGKLDAADYRRLLNRAEAKRDAALAQAQDKRRQADDREAQVRTLDAETEVARRLAAIRQAIAGQVKDAEGIDADRAALTSLFDHFDLYSNDGRVELVPVAARAELPSGAVIELDHPLEVALADETVRLRPKRVPLAGADFLGRRGNPGFPHAVTRTGGRRGR